MPFRRPGDASRRRPAGLVALAALLVAAATLVPPSAHAQLFGQNKVQYELYKWRVWSSDHFDVYAYAGLDSVALRVLDLAEKSTILLGEGMGHQLTRRVPIILYGSHNDFAQTNVTPELIEGSTGGFTEVFRNRVVLPFTGSYEDLRHVVVHELVHAYMFDLLYGGNASSMIASNAFFSVPLWFAEGMAEYFSTGLDDPNMDVYLRDGTIEDYLPPLEYGGGYFVYKQGQSAVGYLVDRYGPDRLKDILQKLRTSRNFDLAFQRATGTTPAKFDEQWREWLRKKYWPTVAGKGEPDDFAKRLTRHFGDGSSFNTSPAVSPHGDRVAFFSDRRQYTEVYVMSAFDGKDMRRLIRGERDMRFESVPSFRSSITWSPDGRFIALTAKSRGRDLLYVVSSANGKLDRSFELDCEALQYPAWSPTSDTVVVTGVKNGRTDLYLVDVATAVVTRITDDAWDEREPVWTPDGRAITFSSDRLKPVVLQPRRFEDGYGRYGLYTIDVATREVELTLDTAGEDRSPAWSPDRGKLLFVSDFGGTPNAFLFDRRDSTVMRLTDVRGGIQSLTWSREGDRIVFSAFTKGGFDIFAVRVPLSLDPVVDRLRYEQHRSVWTLEEAQRPVTDTLLVATGAGGALAGSWPDSLTLAVDTLGTGGALAARDSIAAPRLRLGPPAWGDAGPSPYPALPDSASPVAVRHGLEERGGPFAVPDSVLSQQPNPYRVKFEADFAGGTVFASNVGLLGATRLSLSDFLGDRRIDIGLGLYSNSLSDLNAIVAYSYLPGRWDWSVAGFHFKESFESDMTSLGEQFSSNLLFSERNFGGQFLALYPFDKFRRAEIGYVQRFVERQFYEYDDFGYLVPGEKEYRSISGPTLSLVHDNTLYGNYGPVNGSRWNLSLNGGLPWTPNALSFRTYTLDARHYTDLTRGYTFARRVLLGYSEGRNPQVFRIGGFSTLRGYGDYEFAGTRVWVTNLEFRFPFIRQLGVVGPVPLGVFNLKGAVFADAGMAWFEGQSPRVSSVGPDGVRRLDDLHFDFGTGFRSWFMFLLLKYDVAWRWDLDRTSQPVWQFSIGPEF